MAGAAAVLVVGGVHLQQYVSFMSDVPTIGVLFLLNAAGAAAAATALLLPDRPLRVLGALTGIAVSVGALVSVFLALGGGIFDYQETSYRTAVVIAIASEVLATMLLGAYLATLARSRAAA